MQWISSFFLSFFCLEKAVINIEFYNNNYLFIIMIKYLNLIALYDHWKRSKILIWNLSLYLKKFVSNEEKRYYLSYLLNRNSDWILLLRRYPASRVDTTQAPSLLSYLIRIQLSLLQHILCTIFVTDSFRNNGWHHAIENRHDSDDTCN